MSRHWKTGAQEEEMISTLKVSLGSLHLLMKEKVICGLLGSDGLAVHAAYFELWIRGCELATLTLADKKILNWSLKPRDIR